MRPQVEPLAPARAIRARTTLLVVSAAAVLAGLLVFAAVRLSHGSPTPQALMSMTALGNTLQQPVDDGMTMVVAPAVTAPLKPAQMVPSVEDLIGGAGRALGDPPLPDHDPWVEMEMPSLSEETQPTFDGRPLRKSKTVRMLVTAYSPDERSCGIMAKGVTASGYSVYTNGMKLVAADTSLFPLGTVVTVPGYHGGKPVPVLDRGGVIKGKRLDVLYPTDARARQWGAQWLEVTVWDYADGQGR